MASRTHMVTCCDRHDADLCAVLCQSVDEFVPAAIRHSIVVPSRDYRLFRPLVTPRREIVVAEEILGSGFEKVPDGHRDWRYHQDHLSGWYVQQLLKISASAFVREDIILHLDSDMWFVRPLDQRRLVHGDRVRLYRSPSSAAPSVAQVTWHRSAAFLLGLEPTDYFGADFVEQAVTWRKATVVTLQGQLQRRFGQPWQHVLARQERWSEYVLYGVFVSVLGVDQDRHFMDSGSLSHSLWRTQRPDGIGRDDELESFVQDLRVYHIAAHVQSDIPITVAERTAIYHKSLLIARSLKLGWLMRRIADRARVQAPRFWGPWVALGVRYLEHTSQLPTEVGVLGRIARLPSFFQRIWGNIPLWRLPAVAIARCRQRLRRSSPSGDASNGSFNSTSHA